MEVILLEKVQNLGGLGDKVNVKPGFGRNYLIPSGKAVPATEDNIKQFEARRAELEKAANDVLAEANSRKEKLDGCTITIKALAGEEGKLFGSVGTTAIAEALSESVGAVEKREVELPTGPLHEVGEHHVVLNLHSDVKAEITVVVEAEE
jgi:large subunit ribosomal protein L9